MWLEKQRVEPAVYNLDHGSTYVYLWLSFGLEPQGIPKGGLFLISWDPLDQYGKNAHYLLSVSYRNQAGTDQGVVFELGKKVLKPGGLVWLWNATRASGPHKGIRRCGREG
jgi:hypothetical protein